MKRADSDLFGSVEAMATALRTARQPEERALYMRTALRALGRIARRQAELLEALVKLAAVVLVLSTATACAYRPDGLTIVLDASYSPAYLAALRAALAEWRVGAPDVLGFASVDVATLSLPREEADAPLCNVVRVANLPPGYGELEAEADTTYDQGAMVKADVYMPDAQADDATFAVVARHELGHAWGLGHDLADEPSVMHPTLQACAPHVTPADVAALRAHWGV